MRLVGFWSRRPSSPVVELRRGSVAWSSTLPCSRIRGSAVRGLLLLLLRCGGAGDVVFIQGWTGGWSFSCDGSVGGRGLAGKRCQGAPPYVFIDKCSVAARRAVKAASLKGLKVPRQWQGGCRPSSPSPGSCDSLWWLWILPVCWFFSCFSIYVRCMWFDR